MHIREDSFFTLKELIELVRNKKITEDDFNHVMIEINHSCDCDCHRNSKINVYCDVSQITSPVDSGIVYSNKPFIDIDDLSKVKEYKKEYKQSRKK